MDETLRLAAASAPASAWDDWERGELQNAARWERLQREDPEKWDRLKAEAASLREMPGYDQICEWYRYAVLVPGAEWDIIEDQARRARQYIGTTTEDAVHDVVRGVVG